MELFVFILGLLPLLINSVNSISYCSKQVDSGSAHSYNLSSKVFDKSWESTCGCDSNVVLCLRKCCAQNYTVKEHKCVRGNSSKFDIESISFYDDVRQDSDFRIITGYISCKSYVLYPEEYASDVYYIKNDGEMWMPDLKKHHSTSNFCLDYFEDDEQVRGLVCFPESEISEKVRQSLVAVGMIISMPFLLLTFIVYACLPDRNMHGKSLMCYVITLFGAYCFLVYMQLSTYVLPDAVCKTMGLTCYFLFLVSFFWMNVMSIDIWWAFSGLRGFSGSKKEVEQKRFVLYSLYAWGCPLLLVSIVALLIFIPNVPPNVWYNPGIGTGQCWFRNDYPVLVFFYGPIALIIIANITFFSITIYKIKQVQRDTSMLRKDESKKHSYENDKQRFNLYVKLMLAMGINWSMEIISWVIIWQVGSVPPAIWYLTDFCNALYGVFIFFIFVFKRNIWRMLKRRYYLIMGKPHLARAVTQTGYSSRTTGSSLNNTVTTDCKSAVDDSSVLTSQVA